MRLNERKYYNEVTIPYSVWNEPLSTLINQQDPAMRNIQGLHRLLFLCPQCFKLCVCVCIFKLFQQRIGFSIAKLCPWPFLSVLGHFWHLMLLKATLRAASNSKLWLKLWLKHWNRIYSRYSEIQKRQKERTKWKIIILNKS